MKFISKIQYKKFEDDPKEQKFQGFEEDPTQEDNIKAYEREMDLAKGLNKLLDKRLTVSGKLTQSQVDLASGLQGAQDKTSQILELDKAILKLQNDKTRAGTKLSKDLIAQYNVAKQILQTEIERQKVLDSAKEKFNEMADVLQDMARDLPIIGGMVSKFLGKGLDMAGKAFEKHMESVVDNIQNATDGAKSLAMVFKGMSTMLIGGLIGVLIMIVALFYQMAKAAQQLSKDNSDAVAQGTRQLNISKEMGKQYFNMVGYAKRYGGALAEGIAAAREQLGYLPKLTKEEAQMMARLNADAGISAETIGKMVKQSRKLGVSLDDYLATQDKSIAQMNKQYGVSFDTAEIMNEMASISDDTLALIGKQNGGLERQVFLTKKIGLNTAQAAQIARGLLDIESSIEAEMEARALTGKNINFDLARQKALEGDVAGAAEAVLAQVGGIDEFNKMNIIQKEAIAKAANLEVGQLQKSLEIQDQMPTQQLQATEGQLTGRTVIGKGEAAEIRKDMIAARFSSWGDKLQKIEDNIYDFMMKVDVDTLFSILKWGFYAVLAALAFKAFMGLRNFFRGGSKVPKVNPGGPNVRPPGANPTYRAPSATQLKNLKPNQMINPASGQPIKIGGPTYTKMVNAGTITPGTTPRMPGGTPIPTTPPPPPGGPGSGTKIKPPSSGVPTGPGGTPTPTPSSGGGNKTILGKLWDWGGKQVSKVKTAVAPYTPAQLFKKMGPNIFKFLKGIPVIATAIETVFAGMAINNLLKSGEEPDVVAQGIGKVVMQSIGGLAGGAIASTMTATIMQAVGSLLPGVGNVGMGLINAAIGAAVYMAGDAVGRWLVGMIADNVDLTGIGKFVAKTFAPDSYGQIFGDGGGGDVADDFIWRGGPGGGIQKFNKDDLLIGGTKLRSEPNDYGGGEGGGTPIDPAMIEQMTTFMTAIQSWLQQPLGPKVAITNANGQILGEMIFKDDTGGVQ
jgi:hypothetical protein